MFFHERRSTALQALAGGKVKPEAGNDLAPVIQLGLDLTVQLDGSVNFSRLDLGPNPSTRIALPGVTATDRAQISPWLFTVTAGWRS